MPLEAWHRKAGIFPNWYQDLKVEEGSASTGFVHLLGGKLLGCRGEWGEKGTPSLLELASISAPQQLGTACWHKWLQRKTKIFSGNRFSAKDGRVCPEILPGQSRSRARGVKHTGSSFQWMLPVPLQGEAATAPLRDRRGLSLPFSSFSPCRGAAKASLAHWLLCYIFCESSTTGSKNIHILAPGRSANKWPPEAIRQKHRA